MVDLAAAKDLSSLLAARGDPMQVCRELPWLSEFNDVPDNAAVPLAMSGPHPRAVGSYGSECIEWARAEMGLVPRWWQALAIVRQLEHDDDGALVWREIVDSGPRRIGKSVRLRTSALWRCSRGAELFGETQLAMLVSKDLAVGKEIHRGSWRWAGERDWSVIRLGGAQEIESPGGDRWLLRAPNAAYGYDVGYGQVDESWGVDPPAITDGLEPALLERQSPQLHMTSTAHVKASSLMRRRLTAALRSADPDVLLLLWGAHPDADFADEATWRASSPHWSKDRRDLVARKYAAALAGEDEPEFDDPDPIRGWAAQYLNVWPLLLNPNASVIFPGWEFCQVPEVQPPTEGIVVGIAVSIDRAWSSLAAAVPWTDSIGRERVLWRALSRRRGTGWVMNEVVRLRDEYGCDVAIDGKGPSSPLIPDLERAGVSPRIMSTSDVCDAYGGAYDAVKQGEMAHMGDDDLEDAVRTAVPRPVGDRWAIGRKDSHGDTSMLEAATLAAWCLQNALMPAIY